MINLQSQYSCNIAIFSLESAALGLLIILNFYCGIKLNVET